MGYGYNQPSNSDLFELLRSIRSEVLTMQTELANIRQFVNLSVLKNAEKTGSKNQFEGLLSISQSVKKVNAGGIIGGDKIGGIRGKEKGGKKGGEITHQNLGGETCHNVSDILETVQKLIALIARNCSELEAARLQSKTSMRQAQAMYLKLLKQGYTKQHIFQAVTDATSDDFWSRQFRSLLKLGRKDKDGVLYIDKFLALRQKSHKLPQRARIIV